MMTFCLTECTEKDNIFTLQQNTRKTNINLTQECYVIQSLPTRGKANFSLTFERAIEDTMDG